MVKQMKNRKGDKERYDRKHYDKQKLADVTDVDDKDYSEFYSRFWKGPDAEKIRDYFRPGKWFTDFKMFRDFPFEQGEYGKCVAASKPIVEELRDSNENLERILKQK